MKKLIGFLFLILSVSEIKAQNLFSFGNKQVSKQEFLYSFKKNNTDTLDQKKAAENYLNLFVKFKLKVQAALDLRMDTLANMKTDLQAFKEQIQPMYMLDQDLLNKMISEAHERLQQDIEVAQIFISKENASKLDPALFKNEDFESLALKYSDDADVKNNRGYLGFITAFTLPYFFENVIYSLQNEQVSSGIKSENGMHYFKRISDRNALGKMQTSQILIAIPDNATDDEIRSGKLFADSIHGMLLSGASFDSLAINFSDDKSSASNGGKMLEIEVGKYHQVFEKNIFALKKDNEISAVFRTEYGFHIAKRISHTPVETNLINAESSLKERILQDDRKEIAAKAFEKKSLDIGKSRGMNTKEKNFLINHLAELNPAYASQIKEFKEGNLLFEIMDKKVWGKAVSDTKGLNNFYAQRKNTYQWKESVMAYTITAPSKETADKIRSDYMKDRSTSNIRKLYSEIALIDSGRYETSDLTITGNNNISAGFVSEPSLNESDRSYSFLIIVKKYKDPSIKTFEESKAALINDYQQYLEDTWISTLKKKYPVVINKATLSSILSEIY
jgi:parvulin-like peptidyl-prolyl isomerase